MSASKTKSEVTKTVKATAAMLRPIETAAKRLADAETKQQAAALKTEGLRIALGAVIGTFSKAMVSAGATGEQVIGDVLPILQTAGVHKPDGTMVDWKTVQDWVRAAAANAAMPEEVRERFPFVAQNLALRGIGDEKVRNQTAQRLVKSGKTNVRAIREEVQSVKSKSKTVDSDKQQQRESDAVQRMVDWLVSEHGDAPTFPVDGSDHIDHDAYSVTVALIGASLGRRYPGQQPRYREALAQYLYSGPVAETETETETEGETETSETK